MAAVPPGKEDYCMPPTDLPLAVQLYSMREMREPFEQVLASIAAIGYRGVETVGSQGMTPDELRRLLDRHDLQVVSTHVKLIDLEEDLDQIVAFNRAVGNETLVISSLPLALRPVDRVGWAAVGRRLNTLGKRCLEQEMHLLYHNHEFEMIRYDGRTAIEWMLEGADEEHLGFEPDLAWIVAGDMDPALLLTRFSERCSRIHVKDLARPGEAENERGVADVGYGRLDWPSLLPLARRTGAAWLIVEHDQPADPIASIRRSFDYLRNNWEE
jgi:sugar phosphate isomerase/epimerase